MAILTMIFNQLGIPLSKHKTMGPSHVMEYLGIILDSVKMEARLPLDKLERNRHKLLDFKDKTYYTKRDLSLLGHLNYAARVIPVGP